MGKWDGLFKRGVRCKVSTSKMFIQNNETWPQKTDQ